MLFKLWNFLSHLILLPFVAILAALTAAVYCSDMNRPFELVSHFVPFLVAGSFILLLLAALSRATIISTLAALCLLANSVHLWPQFFGGSERAQEGAGEEIRLLHFNCWGPKNKKRGELAKIAHSERADIICLCEIENSWARQLEGDFADYPYKALFPYSGGIGIISKFPIKDHQEKFNPVWNRPRMIATIALPGGKNLSLLVVHPTIPVYADLFAGRNQDFRDYVKDLADRPAPKMIVGDLNCSPWSAYFARLLKDTGLVDTVNGYGLQLTWSPAGLLPPLLPIDHCLISPDIAVIRRTIEPAAGSDHRPLFVDMRLAR